MSLEFLKNTPDTTAEYAAEDISANKGMAILSYLSILVLIPIFAAKNSPFARFHANQGLVFLVAGIVLNIANAIFGFILAFIPYIGTPISSLVSLAIAVLDIVWLILGIVNAAQGKAKELPIIGGFKLIK